MNEDPYYPHPRPILGDVWNLPQVAKIRVTLLDDDDTEIAWQTLSVPEGIKAVNLTIPTVLSLS